jgi:hypothetical protein
MADDEVGRGERRVDVPVGERAIGHAGVALRRCQQVDDGLERLVLDVDQFERVLRHVAVAGDDDCDRLAGVAHHLVRRRVVRHGRRDAGRKRARERDDVRSREHADDAGMLEGCGDVEPDDAAVRERRPEDRGMAGVRHRREIVDEAALPAEERLVLDAWNRASDPGLPRHVDAHGPTLLSRCGRAPR